jgi:hypothetical protein
MLLEMRQKRLAPLAGRPLDRKVTGMSRSACLSKRSYRDNNAGAERLFSRVAA